MPFCLGWPTSRPAPLLKSQEVASLSKCPLEIASPSSWSHPPFASAPESRVSSYAIRSRAFVAPGSSRGSQRLVSLDRLATVFTNKARSNLSKSGRWATGSVMCHSQYDHMLDTMTQEIESLRQAHHPQLYINVRGHRPFTYYQLFERRPTSRYTPSDHPSAGKSQAVSVTGPSPTCPCDDCSYATLVESCQAKLICQSAKTIDGAPVLQTRWTYTKPEPALTASRLSLLETRKSHFENRVDEALRSVFEEEQAKQSTGDWQDRQQAFSDPHVRGVAEVAQREVRARLLGWPIEGESAR